MGKMIKVGMADLNVCSFPDAITTLGLGSCVGVVLFDAKNKMAGMVHVMLPDSSKFRNVTNPAKYADSGIDELIVQMKKKGADISNLTAKIAGGAQMFAFSSENEMLRIGDRNVEAVKNILHEKRIRIIAQDTGLNYGRTIEFYTETGVLLVKAVGKPPKEI